jgi:hypothetical protein
VFRITRFVRRSKGVLKYLQPVRGATHHEPLRRRGYPVAAGYLPSIVRAVCTVVSAILLLPPIPVFAQVGNQSSRSATVTVNFTPGHPVNRFIPRRALGAGVDGHAEGETQRQLSSANIAAMLSAGLQPLTYRLRTELAGEAWHWNPNGTWSDQAQRQGYWTSAGDLGPPIDVCYGYRLPRRGNTIDQANDDGYSRIDDGDRESFWKSNPYLDEHYTKETNRRNPQWVMIDLGARRKINAIKILWGVPFATNYLVEYGKFVGEEDLSQRLPTKWHVFPRGKIDNGAGGEVQLKLSRRPLSVRYLRLRLDESAETDSADTGDIRDRLGYAIREIYVGSIDRRNSFTDVVRHGSAKDDQTVIYVSSTDPWHREIDRDDQTEQPGFDFIFRSGLTNNLPVLIPVAVLYDTPQNAAAEIRYLTARGYPIERVEMGEEPDGQFVKPEHYGALYLQFYRELHRINPRLQFGGPSMQDVERTQVPGRIGFGKAGWLGGFLRYLKRHGSLDQFSFFSFEWYPFGDDCDRNQLAGASDMLTGALHELELGGLTHKIPWIISEYGSSAFGARAEVDIDGALLNADSLARFLTLGGERAYLYGYEASEVIKEQECSSGNNMLFFSDDDAHIRERTATYWGARLLTQEWTGAADKLHEVYSASSNVKNRRAEPVVTAYPLLRPDGLWSLLLINKDPFHTYDVQVRFRNLQTGSVSGFGGTIDLFQFSGAQYRLNSDPNDPYPIKAGPPAHVIESRGDKIVLPPYSLSVVRGAGETFPL